MVVNQNLLWPKLKLKEVNIVNLKGKFGKIWDYCMEMLS